MSDIDNDADLGDIEINPILPVFPDSSKPCIEVWMEKMKQGLLSCTHFKEHWRVWVPKIFSPEPNVSDLELTYDKEKAQKVLFDTLEQFICNGDPQKVFNDLSQLDNPPSICGRVFKIGEPTYSCRECGMDSTCVLCVDCFKKSAHRHHKYKMGTSSGGGCCDCGDTEAWRQDPFCDIHKVGIEQSCKRQMPEDLMERARVTFSAVLNYAYQLLTLEHSPSLPPDLRIKESDEDPLGFYDTPDTFCTVMFNDETHTFEQVIATLTRLIKCSQKDAIEYVTNIDREGRSVVKCSTFQHCNELKSEIERYTSRNGNRALKVLVVHAHVVAHQIYAMKLLDWLQKILSLSEGFRILFSEVALQTKAPDASIVEGILLRDSHLWKAARSHWHRLIISGMLMEYDSKKAFAKVFTKNYGSVLKDFMRDDHDHSFSVASMSVQVFTVPTLAHYLIATEDAIYVLLSTFLSECTRKLNKNGKLEFERNVANGTFKRAQVILYDLRYLLSSKPKEWTDPLRKGFLHGLQYLLNLLTYMQGMDLVTRQVGQHMEYEPEWESAFNLHIKLAHVITLALEWCGTDRVVLIKSYRMTLKKLHENSSFDPPQGEVRELADHSASCLQYDVSTQPVSIHLPLSRFLAGLHLHLEKFGLNFTSLEFQNQPKPTPEQILETVLRTQVMISQVHAGMWRRNGYSLLNQLYFYHNVKCRSEMLDKDVVLLQVCASLIESNEFLIHLLNKFNLMNWANPQFELNTLKNPEEDSMRQVINLVEEFLGVLVTLVGERHTPGVGQVTEDDRTKKEIIQQLCIKPLAHSELNKALPEDVNHETGMERVINDIAIFKKPTRGLGKGVYELKPHLFDQHNVFFYHYTREELSRSEEAQRIRRKANGELECCPPPSLPPLTEGFMMMANMLQCDVMLHIMQTVLERSLNLRARSFSEAQLHKVLYLIGYALLEEEKQYCQFLVFTERAEKWGLERMIEELCSSARVESHKDLLQWTLTKYRQVLAKKDKGGPILVPVMSSAESSAQSEEAAKEEKEWRAKKAAEKRAKIMAQMAAMQKNFMKENAKLFESSDIEMVKQELTGSLMDLSENCETTPVALGRDQTARPLCDQTYTCILCQEDEVLTAGGRALVLAAFVQQSTVLCQHRENADHHPDPLYLPATLGYTPHTSTCGHIMHNQCWQKYFENVLAKENRRPYRIRQPTSFDIEKQEYLCPLCECLNNTVLPLIPPLAALETSQPSPDLSFDFWLQSLCVALKYKKRLSQHSSDDGEELSQEGEGDANSQPLQTVIYTCPINQVVVEVGEPGQAFASLFPVPSSEQEQILSLPLTEMVSLFCQATYTKGLGVNINTGDPRVPLLAWKSCAYTIISVECLLRNAEKPLFGDLSCRQKDCLECLVRLVAILGSNKTRFEVITSHALRLLSMILDAPSDAPCILDWDSFGLLVALNLSIRSLFLGNQRASIPTGNLQELYVLQLVFLSHIVKILLTCDLNRRYSYMDVEEVEDESTLPILELLQVTRKAAGINTENVQQSSNIIWSEIQRASLPFLRCAAIFYHFLTGVPAPQSLMEIGGDTFENLCQYLGLPTSCKDILSITNVQGTVQTALLALKWAEHKKVRQYLSKQENAPVVRPPLPVNQLVPLPLDYSELINNVSVFNCPNNDREDSRNPTMCLVCGVMLCSQSYCCQTELNKILVGACTYHAHECGAGVGIFLRVRECEILLLASPNRGCFMTPPYLDQYGETDQGLRRGNPLRLCPERYKKLQQLWLSHGIHEEIARALESSSNLVSTQWQHL